MKLNINGEIKSFELESLSVAELLVLEAVKLPEMVSIQLNDEFLRQGEYASKNLNDGDVINFLYFMGGRA
ncbi:MAG: sulfur carrier protein ThiS [Wolinella sp.]